MPFAITVANLIEIMKEPGCPICAVEQKAARKAVDVFLHENLMDFTLRDRALASYGYCPPHTRLLAATELSNSGLPLGVSILYEVLNQRTSQELKDIARQPALARGFGRLLGKLGLQGNTVQPSVLHPATCPICETAGQTALNNLSALFEEIERGKQDTLQAYETSDGICLRHLREGLLQLAELHPHAARYLSERAARELAEQAGQMQMFIRKKNWEYRDEKLTPEEANAWRKSLTFYTGYPGDSFTFDLSDFG